MRANKHFCVWANQFKNRSADHLRCARGKGREAFEHVVGDLLFSVVNLSRFAKVDPEQALNRSVEKFVNRFRAMERKIMLDKKDFGNYTVEELDILWEKSKAEEQKM